jgi:ArsR family transcriptional regulator
MSAVFHDSYEFMSARDIEGALRELDQMKPGMAMLLVVPVSPRTYSVEISRQFDMMWVMPLSVSKDLEQAQRWFHALSDETRLQLLELLREGEQCVCDLTDALDAAQSRLSFHLKTLKDAGLVSDRRQGRWVYYALNPQAFDEITEFMSELRPKPSGFRLTPRRCD